MKNGKVETYINGKLEREGALHMTVIDPHKNTYKDILPLSKALNNSGTDLIAIGGTLGILPTRVDLICRKLHKNVNAPIIIFPSNVWSYSKYADAVFFISMINSRNPYYITGEPILAASLLSKMKIEIIPVAYLLFEPGLTAGWIADANLIPRRSSDIAKYSALAGQYQGAKMIFMEAGSGCDEHIPLSIIREVKKSISLPLIVGSGIRNPKDAALIVRAGADIIDTGSAFEKNRDISDIVRAVKIEGKKRILQKADEKQ